MLLSHVRAKNYRSLRDVSIPCSHLTAFVGANGMGKSTILRAINLFYAGNPQLGVEDWFGKVTNEDIEITLTFEKLSEAAKERFAAYIEGETLSVTRRFKMSTSGRATDSYHGVLLRHAPFVPLLNMTGQALKPAYNDLRSQEPYSTSLPAYSNLETAKKGLFDWETTHPESCVLTADEGQFFGFKQVGQGYLGDFTCMIFVPAVRDLSDDAAEGRGSAVTALVDIVARNVLAAQKSFRDLESEMQTKFHALIKPSQSSDLAALSELLSGTLQAIAPDAGVHLSWVPPPPVQFPMPKVDVRLSEDGQPFSIAGTGHGLQRAFIVTLLQHLAVAQRKRAELENSSTEGTPIALPNILLAIEEPELYQHPTRQRHLARLLLSLAKGQAKGVADTTQVMYATHCPLFVGIDRFDEVRVVTKSASTDDGPRQTEVAFKTLDDIARVLEMTEKVEVGTYTAESVQARLSTTFTPWLSEGFFADTLLLVEGPTDRASLMGAADVMGKDFDQLGIAVLPCDAKSKLLTAAAIFRSFGLPTYCVWDGDAHKGPSQGICSECQRPLDKKPHPIENQRIMRLLGKQDDEWPNFVDDDAACLPHCLEHTLKDELGKELYDRLLPEVAEAFGYSKLDHAKKNSAVVAELFWRAAKENAKSTTFEKIVTNVYKLRKPEKLDVAATA